MSSKPPQPPVKWAIEDSFPIVEINRHRPAREVINTLYEGVREFCGHGAQPDDMTAVRQVRRGR